MRERIEQGIDEREISETSLSQATSPTQITQSAKKRKRSISAWMRYFYTEDLSPDNHPIIELQRRATWVGLAVILQALNEIPHPFYIPHVPFLKPWQGVIPFVLILGSFIALWMAFCPPTLKQRLGRAQGSSLLQARPRRWQIIILVGVLLTSIAGGILFGRSIAMSFFMPPLYTNDGTSLDANAAALLLQGRNPYTDSSILHLLRQYPIQPNWTTPLREGQFADRLTYPSLSELRSVLDTDLKAGHALEFESKVSYPALSFLTLVPYIWLNIFNVLSFYLFCYVVLVAIAWKVARPELRPWVLLLALANVPLWTSVMGGNLDILYILLIALTWLLRERGWLSALFLGLALASKQPAWLFVPFYVIMVWRQHNFMEAVRRLLIAGGVALAINLPFIVWNSHAWLAGVLAPVADPMFPLGAGLISLGTTPLLPIFAPWIYDVLEAMAMLLALAWYWRLCKVRPEAAMLLAVLPLFFAWRSLSSYFYGAAFSLFLLMAVKALPGKSKPARKLLSRPQLMPFDNERSTPGDIPIPAGVRAALQSMRSFNWMIAKIVRVRPPLASMSNWFGAPPLEPENEQEIDSGPETLRPQSSTG